MAMVKLGYLLVKVRKTITICLFSEIREDLEDFCENGMQIVPLFECGKDRYIEINSTMVKLM